MIDFIEGTSYIIAWALTIIVCGFGISLTLTGFYILGKRLIANFWGSKALIKFYAQLIKDSNK